MILSFLKTTNGTDGMGKGLLFMIRVGEKYWVKNYCRTIIALF